MVDSYTQYPCLTSSNYYIWIVRIRSILQAKDCWEAVIGYSDEECTEISAQERRRRQNANCLALSILSKTVSDEFIIHIEQCTTAKECWEVLENVNTKSNVYDQICSLRDLINIKKTKDISVSQYVSNMLTLNKKVQRMGVVFQDRALGTILLAGLPPEEYEVFIRSIDKSDDLSTASVTALLKTEEKRMKMIRLKLLYPRNVNLVRRILEKGAQRTRTGNPLNNFKKGGLYAMHAAE
jgi:hypothetical protein